MIPHIFEYNFSNGAFTDKRIVSFLVSFADPFCRESHILKTELVRSVRESFDAGAPSDLVSKRFSSNEQPGVPPS